MKVNTERNEFRLGVKLIPSGSDRYIRNRDEQLFHVKQLFKKGGTANTSSLYRGRFLFKGGIYDRH